MAEMAEIFILTQRRRGRRVLFEHGLNGFLYPAEFFNYLSHRNGGNGGNFYSHAETQRVQSFITHTDLTDLTDL